MIQLTRHPAKNRGESPGHRTLQRLYAGSCDDEMISAVLDNNRELAGPAGGSPPVPTSCMTHDRLPVAFGGAGKRGVALNTERGCFGCSLYIIEGR